MKDYKEEAIGLAKDYNHISPCDLEMILETLEDSGCLSERGKSLKNSFWEIFIRS